MKKFNDLFKDEKHNDGVAAKYITLNTDTINDDLAEAIDDDFSDMSSDDMAIQARLYSLESIEEMADNTDNDKHKEKLLLLVEFMKSENALFVIFDIF